MTKAFDLACFMPVNPTVQGDTVVVTQASPMRTDWVSPGGGAVIPPATAQGQNLVSGPGPGFAWTAQAPPPDAPSDGHAYARINGAWGAVWTKAEADARYQAANTNLNAIAGLSGTGLLQSTGAGAWSFIQDFDAGTY